MELLKGWRTLIVAALALVWAALDTVGVAVPLAEQEAIATAIFALAAIITRVLATGPVPFRKKETLQ